MTYPVVTVSFRTNKRRTFKMSIPVASMEGEETNVHVHHINSLATIPYRDRRHIEACFDETAEYKDKHAPQEIEMNENTHTSLYHGLRDADRQ